MLTARRLLRLLAVLTAFSLLAACGASPAAGGNAAAPAQSAGPDGNTEPTQDAGNGEVWGPYTFTDSTGKTVTLAERPQRVAVLFSSYADIWTTAGGMVDITVGESVERGFADRSAVLVDPGAGHTAIDTETLVAAAPDLVIGTADYECQAEAAALCGKAGIPAALFRVECFADYLDVLRIFCDITGKENRYERYGTQAAARIEALLAQTGKQAQNGGTRFLFVRAGSSARSTKAKTAGDNFVCAMLSELGADNIAERETGLTGELSLEVILQQDPDYLFISTMGDEAAAREYMDSLLRTDGWRELTCVAEGRYCYLPKEMFHFKPNARWADAYEYLARILYPELAP